MTVLQAVDTDDRLGWTMRAIRAAEKDRVHTIGKCIKAYPELACFFSSTGIISTDKFEQLRQHAILLHRSSLLEELRDIHRPDNVEDDTSQAYRKSKVQAKLNNLKPGHCSVVGAILSQEGILLTDPREIAQGQILERSFQQKTYQLHPFAILVHRRAWRGTALGGGQ